MESRPLLKNFSIIIPTRNRPALLDRCLRSLSDLNYPKTDFEVLVVDDGSDPPLQTIIERHTAHLPVRYLRREGQGPARARNAALQQATGEYIVFTDDDCVPDADWLKVYEAAFRQFPAVGFGGKIVDDPQNEIYGKASQMLVTFLYEGGSASIGAIPFFCSNNFAFPREALLRLNGFDESFPLAAAEDRDLCARWLQFSDMQFLATAIIHHRQMLNFKSFWRQQFRYGRGAYQFWLRREEDKPKPGMTAFSFYYRLLSFPFSRAPFFEALALSGLLGVSQLANTLGYFAEHNKAHSV